VSGPIHVVADAVGNVDGLRQRQAHDPGMVVVKTRVVSGHDGIMFRHPLEFARIFYSARDYGVSVNRPVFVCTRFRPQRIFGSLQQTVPGIFRVLSIYSWVFARRMTERRAQISERDSGKPRRETSKHQPSEKPPDQAIATVTPSSSSSNSGLTAVPAVVQLQLLNRSTVARVDAMGTLPHCFTCRLNAIARTRHLQETPEITAVAGPDVIRRCTLLHKMCSRSCLAEAASPRFRRRTTGLQPT
jgi:hypothetical protein